MEFALDVLPVPALVVDGGGVIAAANAESRAMFAGELVGVPVSALFVRLGRFPGAEPPEPLSGQAVHTLVRACALAAGVPARLAHLHALRTYWATSLLEDGVPIHRVSNRLGHADLRTTSRYAADHPDQVDDVADVLDRRHQALRRAGR